MRFAPSWARAVTPVLAVFTLLSAGSLTAGCRGADDGSVTVGVGGQPFLVYLPTTLAERLGYYREEGLKVRLEDLQSGSKALQALQGGSVDVVSGFYDHTIQMRAKGRDVRAFVSMLRYPSLVLAVSPKAGRRIESVADLAGANVGVTSPGSSTDFFLKNLLRANRLPTTAASVQAIGGDASAVAAMEQGAVDAAVMTDPAFSLLRKRAGEVRVLSDTRTVQGVQQAYGTDTYPASVFYSTGEWLQRNPAVARKLARAMRRTLEWIQQHSAAEIAAKLPPRYAAGDPAVYVEAIAHAKPAFSPDGRVEPAGAHAVYEVQRLLNPEVANARIDLDSTYTNEFVTD